MTKIIITLFMLINIAQAGIGDVVGGQSKEVKKLLRSSRFIRGDKILFQKDSTYVSAVYSKSLCFDGYDFRATSVKCTKWSKSEDSRRCIKREKVTITQPSNSLRERCRLRREGECEETVVVDFNQSDVKKIKFYVDESSLLKSQKVKVKDCQ